MPSRVLREGILTSERVDRIAGNPSAEVFYRRLQSVVDDYGLYDARPQLLRSALYPLRIDKVSDSDIAGYLSECAAAGLIRLYTVAAKPYVQVLDFRQRTRAMRTKFPPPPGFRLDTDAPAGEWRSGEVLSDG
jgi:hypothetical protein